MRKQIPIVAGNLLEWFDFCLYGCLAPLIAPIFFPQSSEWTALVLIFSIYCMSYFAKPFGGFVFGWVGDVYGRKPMLMISLSGLSLCSLFIGLLPTYGHVGFFSPALLAVLRIFQGLFIGAEYSGAMVYQVESSQKHPGFAGSWIEFTSTLGGLLAASSVSILSFIVGDAALKAYAWRIPFIAAALFGLVILRWRSQLPNDYHVKRENTLVALWRYFKHHPNDFFVTFFLSGFSSCALYYLTYENTFITGILHYPLKISLDFQIANTILMLVLMPLVAWWADYHGLYRAVLKGGVLMLLLGPLGIYWMSQTSLVTLFIGQVFFSLVITPFIAIHSALSSRFFPVAFRCRSFGISHNTSVAFFGGTTPLVALFMIHFTGVYWSAVFYFICIGCVALFFLSKRKNTPSSPLESI